MKRRILRNLTFVDARCISLYLRMSEVITDAMQLHSNSSEEKVFDVYLDSGEETVDHCGLSDVKKSSGVICLMCMKFFLDDIAAEEHTRSLLHYQHYYIALQEIGKDCSDVPHHVGALYESVASYEDDYSEELCTDEIEKNLNNECITIKKCYGIFCSACKQFFVSEISAGQHVRSLAHYRKCYSGSEAATPKKIVTEKLIPKDYENNSFCREVEHNGRVKPVIILQNGKKPDFLEVLCDTRHSPMTTQVDSESLEEGEIKDGDSEGSVWDSQSSVDNDWWHDFDETLETLLHDIRNDNGEV